jgi:hypothetical protein
LRRFKPFAVIAHFFSAADRGSAIWPHRVDDKR